MTRIIPNAAAEWLTRYTPSGKGGSEKYSTAPMPWAGALMPIAGMATP
jgi:hypothetical protein